MDKYLLWFLFSLLAAVMLPADFVLAETPAKRLFGKERLPAKLQPQVHGFYTKGCLSGAVAIPIDGPNWQAMRLSRNRRWGHPDLIRIIEELSYKGKSDGWYGLMVGDISQPRGGPMLTGHRSHQVGLDADIWFNPMPEKRLSFKEREEISAVSVLKKGSVYVDDSKWTRSHTMLLYHAASFPEVERVLVHPGVKKKLCDTVKGNRKWLNKIRPTWGHHYHFHVRIGCPKGSPGCKRQKSTGTNTGCNDGSLDWWFNVEFGPKKKPAKPSAKKTKPRKQLRLTDLPQSCQLVLSAEAENLDEATFKIQEAAFTAPNIKLPKFSAANAFTSRPIEASAGRLQDNALIPVPTKRPSP